jgi:hypothetical protein
MKQLLFVALSALGLTLATQSAAIHAQQAAGKAMTVAGSVKAVTADSLTVSSGGKDMTFKIDGTTKFVAKGLSTKSAKGKITATDAVGADDVVRVTYHDMGGTLHAANVRVTAKAPGRK